MWLSLSWPSNAHTRIWSGGLLWFRQQPLHFMCGELLILVSLFMDFSLELLCSALGVEWKLQRSWEREAGIIVWALNLQEGVGRTWIPTWVSPLFLQINGAESNFILGEFCCENFLTAQIGSWFALWKFIKSLLKATSWVKVVVPQKLLCHHGTFLKMFIFLKSALPYLAGSFSELLWHWSQ